MYRIMQLQVMAVISVVLMGCDPNPSATNQPETKELITFKGVPFGKPGAKDALKRLCLAEAKSDTGDCTDSTAFRATYGTLQDQSTGFDLGEGEELRRLSMLIGSEEVPALVAMLTLKYGSPKTNSSILRNGLGTEFTNYVYRWVDREGTSLEVKTYLIDSPNPLVTGHVLFKSSAELDAEVAKTIKDIEAAKAKL